MSVGNLGRETRTRDQNGRCSPSSPAGGRRNEAAARTGHVYTITVEMKHATSSKKISTKISHFSFPAQQTMTKSYIKMMYK